MAEQEFKVGDKLRLMPGGGWPTEYTPGGDPFVEMVVNVIKIDEDGHAIFTYDGDLWEVNEDYPAELWGIQGDERYQTLTPGYTFEETLAIYRRMQEHVEKKLAEAEDQVHHPSHYTAYEGLEIIDLTRQMPFLEGNVVKYVTRAKLKGNEVQDLQKARLYLDWAIEDAVRRAEKEKGAL